MIEEKLKESSRRAGGLQKELQHSSEAFEQAQANYDSLKNCPLDSKYHDAGIQPFADQRQECVIFQFLLDQRLEQSLIDNVE